MRFSFIPAVALALLLAPAAYADVVYDTAVGAVTGSDGYFDGVTGIAASFAVPAAQLGQIELNLSAMTPSDGGSFSVYLVPDVGGSAGVAGTPAYSSSDDTFTSFGPGAVLLGTVLDSTLSSIPTLVSFGVTSTPTSSDGVYWVGLELIGSSSVEWAYNDLSVPGVGTAGQSDFFFNSFDPPGFPNPLGPTIAALADLFVPYGPYEMIVTTPEPMSIALLGVGMAGLGFARRRAAKKA